MSIEELKLLVTVALALSGWLAVNYFNNLNRVREQLFLI